MQPIEKLARVSDFLRTMHVGKVPVIFTTNAQDATARLNNATGVQIVTSRPELHQTGDSTTINAVAFVLIKGLGTTSTPELESEQFDDLLTVTTRLVLDGIVSSTDHYDCVRSLLGIELESYDIVPEASIFGGWLGWSVEMTFS